MAAAAVAAIEAFGSVGVSAEFVAVPSAPAPGRAQEDTDRLAAAIEQVDPDVVVSMFGVWERAAWVSAEGGVPVPVEMARRVGVPFVGSVTGRRVRLLMVEYPPVLGDAGPGITAVNDGFALAAAVGGAGWVETRSVFGDTYTEVTAGGARLRKPGGNVHLCPDGAAAVARLVVAAAGGLPLGGTWAVGSWRNGPVFEGC